MAKLAYSERVCSTCKQVKPYTIEFFESYRRNKSGLGPRCRACSRESSRRDYHIGKGRVPPDRRGEAPDGYRICLKCKEAKPATREHFSASSLTKDGRTSYCRPCFREYCRAQHAANLLDRKAKSKIRRAATADVNNAKIRAYYAANLELVRAKKQQWRDANRATLKAQRATRRARICGAAGKHTANDIKALYQKQNGLCRWCLIPVGEAYHVDHVIPLSRGGGNGPGNLVISCPSCNCRKSDKLPEHFLSAI